MCYKFAKMLQGFLYNNDLNDPESEWDLLLRVSKWLVDASYVEPSDSMFNPDLVMIGIVSIVGVVAVVAGAILYRRMNPNQNE